MHSTLHARRTPLVLHTIDEVRALRRRLASGGAPPHQPIRIEAPHLAPAGRSEIEGRLTAAALACGCGAGNVWASAALLGYTLYLGAAAGSFGALTLRHLGWGVAVVLAAAVAGKLATLARARFRFAVELDRLLALMQAPHSPSLAQEG
jgi:hypothetical protein